MALIRMTRRAPAPLLDTFMDDMPDRIRRMLEGTLPVEPVMTVGWNPPVEMKDLADELVVTAELPGIAAKNVDVNVDNGVLTISGEKTEEKKEGEPDSQFYMWERRYGSFRRSFTLPTEVDIDRVTADFDNVILTIKLPKSEKVKAKGKKISVAVRK